MKKPNKKDTLGSTKDAVDFVDRLKGFRIFWESYPKKEDKDAARRSWAAIFPRKAGEDSSIVARILSSLDLYKKSRQWERDSGVFIPKASAFLDQKKWEKTPANESRRNSNTITTKRGSERFVVKRTIVINTNATTI